MKWTFLSNRSLKYRIATIVVLVEAILLALVLSVMAKDSQNALTKQNSAFERIIISSLSEFARTALLTQQFDALQLYINELSNSPNIQQVLLLNQENQVIVSSEAINNPASLLLFENTDNTSWTHIQLNHNQPANGDHSGALAIQFSNIALLEADKKTRRLVIAIAILGTFIMAVTGMTIGKSLTTRIELLRTAAIRLAKGDHVAEIEAPGNDELSNLGKTFNDMSAKITGTINELYSNQKELLLAQSSLEQRIIERTEQLAVARDNALDANKTKSKFLANMSHELRTPLNAIIGYSELLSESTLSDQRPEFVKDLDKIRYSGTHLLGLINQILDLSKIEAGKAEIYVEKIGIKQIAYEAVINIKPVMEKNGNTIKLDLTDDIADIYSDRTKLVQILINLLQNAAKFTKKGTITLSVTSYYKDNSEWLDFSVRDTGIGIAKENINKLFNDFSQADESTTRRYGGSGLGLAICKNFSLLMGGNMSIESELGVGSVFTLSLPQNIDTFKSTPSNDSQNTQLNSKKSA